MRQVLGKIQGAVSDFKAALSKEEPDWEYRDQVTGGLAKVEQERKREP